MTRIAYRHPDEMTERARELTLERGNLNVYRALANAEKVFTGWMLAGSAALSSPVLPLRLRELVILRVAFLMDCPYELGQHVEVARGAGLTEDEIRAVTTDTDWQATGYFTAIEQSVLKLSSELLTARCVAAETLNQVQKALGPEATVEVLQVLSRWAGLALMLNALDVDLDESARLVAPPRDGLEP